MHVVYLIHLRRPLVGNIQSDEQRALLYNLPPRKPGWPVSVCNHYLGSTNNLTRRLEEHRTGNGAAMLRNCMKHGIEFDVVRVWNGGFDLEKELKRHKKNADFCPICRGGLKTEPWIIEQQIIEQLESAGGVRVQLPEYNTVDA